MIAKMKNLAIYLDTRGISQSAFAVTVGVSQPTVWHWLNGSKTPRASTLMKIADETGLSVDQLLDRETIRGKTHKTPMRNVRNGSAVC